MGADRCLTAPTAGVVRGTPRARRRGHRPDGWRVALAGLLALALYALPAPARCSVLEDIDARQQPRSTLVTIRLSENTTYAIGTLDPDGDRPFRLYIDLEDTTLGNGAQGDTALDAGGPLLRIRTGQFTQSTARVVLDFKEQAPFTVKAYRGPFRIVLAIGQVSAERMREPRAFTRREAPATEPTVAAAPAPAPAATPPATTPAPAAVASVWPPLPVPAPAPVRTPVTAPPAEGGRGNDPETVRDRHLVSKVDAPRARDGAPRVATPESTALNNTAPKNSAPESDAGTLRAARPLPPPEPEAPRPAVDAPGEPQPLIPEVQVVPPVVASAPKAPSDAARRIDAPDHGRRDAETAPAREPRPAHVARAAVPPASTFTDSHRIIIDPGHGGRDPGARSVDGAWEKDLALSMARFLAKRVRERLGVPVALTRRGDETLSIRRRAAMARDASLLISVHANTCPDNWVEGVQTFYAERGQHAAESRRLARLVHHRVVGAIDTDYGPVRDGGVHQRDLGLLRMSPAPSFLIETGYLSNPADRRRLDDPDYRLAVTDGIVDGIADYLAGMPDPLRLIAQR